MKFSVFFPLVLLFSFACSQGTGRTGGPMSGGDDGHAQGGADDAGGSAGSVNGGAGDTKTVGGESGTGGIRSTGGTTSRPAGGSGGTAAAGTGGAGGSASTTLNTGGVPAPASCGDLGICDTFEGFALGAYSGGQFAIDGGLTSNYVITGEQKHSGQKSIKVDTNNTGISKRFLKATLGTKLGDGKNVFARAWMFFPQLPKLSRSDGSPHYRLIRSFETIPPTSSTVVSAGINGVSQGRLLYFKAEGFKDCAADGASLPANKWTCVEFRSDTSGYEAWIDGRSMGARSTVSGDNCWQKRDKVVSVEFGFEIAAGNLDQPLTFFMDDIALDEKRIGCN
jgi:hypothetical protein